LLRRLKFRCSHQRGSQQQSCKLALDGCERSESKLSAPQRYLRSLSPTHLGPNLPHLSPRLSPKTAFKAKNCTDFPGMSGAANCAHRFYPAPVLPVAVYRETGESVTKIKQCIASNSVSSHCADFFLFQRQTAATTKLTLMCNRL
jgi:hypothetical protein